MGDLAGKHIIVGVTGGIAAYKAVEVVSRLKKQGADVKVIMTRAAQEFVTELTFREISGNEVHTFMWAKAVKWQVEHIALAEWADVILIAPATANVIAKLANGIADDMLTTVCLATKAPLIISPAMNTNMYENFLTQENIAKLKAHRVTFIEPAAGKLACGVTGVGRLPEPAFIAEFVKNFFADRNSLQGKKIIVTAGGTIAPIDPVRFIGNRSSGRMGYAIAEAAKNRGAEVVLITGVVSLPDIEGIKTIHVEITEEMREAVIAEFADADAVVKAAAVADYKLKEVSKQKVKKSEGTWQLELVRNPDILYELGQKKKPHQVLVGFAAETENLEEYAKKKIAKKNLDFIVANDITKPGAGFKTDTNIAVIIDSKGEKQEFPLMQKSALAENIIDRIENILLAD